MRELTRRATERRLLWPLSVGPGLHNGGVAVLERTTVTEWTTVGSPLGELLLTGRDGALTGLFMPPHRHGPEVHPDWERTDDAFTAVTEQLRAYFAGELREFDVPLAMSGTPFQQRVWAALRTIPYGETRSYGELARSLDMPTAFRAVGAANGRNPVSIIVPCHRVVGSTGALIGYGGGVDNKRTLLDLERGSLF